MEAAQNISAALRTLADSDKAYDQSRFFKCGKGEYGEGDRFLGIRVPDTRAIVKDNIRGATLDDADLLTRSPWHEERLAGFMVLIELYARACRRGANPGDDERVADFYYKIIERGNNWDLVDLVAPKILGHRLISDSPTARTVLTQFAASGNLWKERAAMVATLTEIRTGEFSNAFHLAAQFLRHPHDLMHKAVGWMLREVGKRDEKAMKGFLDRHYNEISRTTLRYAIERLPEMTRREYLARDAGNRRK